MLTKKDKEKIIALVNDQASRAHDGAIADYTGTDVTNMTELRNLARENRVFLKITRNTLIKRGLTGTQFSCMESELEGPTLLGFSLEEAGSVARLFKDFAKKNPSFRVKCLAVNGRFLPADEIDTLASLPTREQALSMLAGILQAPLGSFAVLLNQVPTGLARVLREVQQSKSS